MFWLGFFTANCLFGIFILVVFLVWKKKSKELDNLVIGSAEVDKTKKGSNK